MDMQFKAFKLAPLLAMLLLAVLMLWAPHVDAGDVRVFWEDFSGGSLNIDEWRYQGSVEVGGGILNLTNGRLHSRRYFGYGTLELRMRVTDTGRDVLIRLQSWLSDDGSDSIGLILASETGGNKYKARTESGGSWQERWLDYVADTDWHVYKIVWEPDRVLFYVDGELKGELTLTEHVNKRLSRINLRSDLEGGQLIQVDWIRYVEDYEYSRGHPSLIKARASTNDPWIHRFLKLSWFEENHTLQLKPDGGDFTADFDIYIPRAYRNYICEVYDDGVKLTNIAFKRAERTLRFSTTITGADPDLIEVRLVDPEPWMVQLYYSLLPLGIDIGVLLKWYDRLKKKHPALPWLLFAIFILLIIFAGWALYKLLSGVRI